MNKPALAYCTNIHAGTDLDSVKSNLQEYAVSVQRQTLSGQTLGVGLWLSDQAAREIDDRGQAAEFGEWLSGRNLVPFTFNAFPQSNFHQPIVKHKVYQPSWAVSQRLEYTLQIARILDWLLPPEMDGTISTLPLGWPTDSIDNSFFAKCAENLIACARGMADLSEASGRNIRLCLEPEPGCLLQRSADVIGFVEQHLSTESDLIADHLGVCHDVCHAAVMFESQEAAISAYRSAQIAIGKVQVSSAIEARFGESDGPVALLNELSRFTEPRYLHQTVVDLGDPADQQFFEDLPMAIGHCDAQPQGTWRVHFHVPIYLERIGLLSTTQTQIKECLAVLASEPADVHFEVETYAWNVSPQDIRTMSLADSIAAEVRWLADRLG